MSLTSTLDAARISITNRVGESHGIPALITQELKQHGPCTFETLLNRLPICTWNQVFVAVDGLSRNGTVILQPYARFEYMLSMAPLHSTGPTRHIPTEAREYRDSRQVVMQSHACTPTRSKNTPEKGELA
ncbi:MAG: uncharacterized protein K0S45_2854 [Nitrospira sp.]|jgi:hypothetical protein|nr:uncharacterized protein [Nitrospira sp.]